MKSIEDSNKKKISIMFVVIGAIISLIGLLFLIGGKLSETVYGMLVLSFIWLIFEVIALIIINYGYQRCKTCLEATSDKVIIKYPKRLNGTPYQGYIYNIYYDQIETVTAQQESIVIKTKTGTYMIRFISNSIELCKYINGKLVNKQPVQNEEKDSTDNLEKLYKLYQSNVITLEEYEQKKKEILSRL